MNKGQIMSAMGDLEKAFKLIHSAEDKLEENGIKLCGINPDRMFGKDGVHVYVGIDELAEAAGAEVEINEFAPNKDKGFTRKNLFYYQIQLEDGSYREREDA